MKRSKPLKRTELRRGDSQLKRTRIKPVSDKRRAGGPARQAAVAAAFERDGWRLVDGRWIGGRCIPHERGWPGSCFGELTPHRLHKGSAGGGYTTDNVVAACSFSNGDIENRHDLAVELGLLIQPKEHDT